MKKKINEMLKHIPAAERLEILDSLCDRYRKESRREVDEDVNSWKSKKGIPRIKTDY